jgi:hypothetical protein
MLPGHPYRVVVASLNICRWGVGCHAQTGRECQSYDPRNRGWSRVYLEAWGEVYLGVELETIYLGASKGGEAATVTCMFKVRTPPLLHHHTSGTPGSVCKYLSSFPEGTIYSTWIPSLPYCSYDELHSDRTAINRM